MIRFIAHRVNSCSELLKLDRNYGVEVDLRDNIGGKIYLQHDPFVCGDDFEEYCKIYRHGIMILNIKSEGIEYRALEILEKYSITEYFFLDNSFPMIYALSKGKNVNIALRYSEYEGLDTIRNLTKKAKWIWVDCFTRFPLNRDVYREFLSLDYKICIVSPELQRQEEKIKDYASLLLHEGIFPDAICTKVHNIEKWKQLLYL